MSPETERETERETKQETEGAPVDLAEAPDRLGRQPTRVDDIIAKGCVGLGIKRIEKLSDIEAALLALKLGVPNPPVAETARDELNQAILKFKTKHRDALVARAAASSNTEDCKDAPPPPLPPPTPRPCKATSDTAARQATFANRNRHGMTIMAFNSLKLRVNRKGLADQWLDFVRIMSTVDVVLLSEVPSNEAKARTQQLVALMTVEQQGSDVPEEWSFAVSEPSGPGNPEVHVAIVKRPIRLIESITHTHANGVALDHSPFSVKVNDPRFSRGQAMVLTSVHFPPATRAKDRDRQMEAFFKSYGTTAEMRMNEPFTFRGAKDARKNPVVHVVAGDFNAYPLDKVPDLNAHGWGLPLIGSQVATSAGRKSFDHFVPDAHTAETFNLSWEVLQLAIPQNSSKGIIGLSDHDPIVMTIKEVTRLVNKIKEEDPDVVHKLPHAYRVSSPEQQQPPAAPTDEPPDTDEPPETDATTDTDAAGASEAASSLSTDRPVVPPNAFERTVLCFDTETAGFSPPAICQLAYSLYKNGQVTHFNKILRLPVGVTINKAATEIHGITNRQVATEGWPAGPELLAFWELVQSVYADHGTVLGHNVSFDCRAFNASVQKHGITLAGAPLDAADMFCTMSASSRWSTLTTKRGGRKNFKLAELYEALHGQPPHWARLHNALDDVHVTVACYYTGAQKGWW